VSRHTTAVHFYGCADDDRVQVDIARGTAEDGLCEWIKLSMDDGKVEVTFFDLDRAPFIAAMRAFLAAEDARTAAAKPCERCNGTLTLRVLGTEDQYLPCPNHNAPAGADTTTDDNAPAGAGGIA
jgi:hypothetical protein